jgi:hypothetical protein
VEAHLGHKTPEAELLARAATDYANLLYLLAGIAASVACWAALAGGWWLVCSWAARRGRYHRDERRAGDESPPQPRVRLPSLNSL